MKCVRKVVGEGELLPVKKKTVCTGKEGDIPVQTDQNSDPERGRTSVLSMPR